MFTVDDRLFVVGVATKATTLEAGRLRSLEIAKGELRGRSKALGEARWQELETSDIYEEREADGTFTIYRLASVKTHGYTALVLDPEQSKEVAKILARIEEKRFREAREQESLELQQTLREKRGAVGWDRFKRAVSSEGLESMCAMARTPESKQDNKSCQTLEELDVQIAQLEADDWRWNKFEKRYDHPPSWLWNTKTERYEPPDPSNKEQFKPLPMECYSGLSWLHFKFLQLIGTCRE